MKKLCMLVALAIIISASIGYLEGYYLGWFGFILAIPTGFFCGVSAVVYWIKDGGDLL